MRYRIEQDSGRDASGNYTFRIELKGTWLIKCSRRLMVGCSAWLNLPRPLF